VIKANLINSRPSTGRAKCGRKMEQKILIGLATTVLVGAFGFVIKEWTTWTSTTLINLNSRAAVLESEVKHTNQLVSQNYEMLKFLVNNSQKAGYNDNAWTNAVPGLHPTRGQ